MRNFTVLALVMMCLSIAAMQSCGKTTATEPGHKVCVTITDFPRPAGAIQVPDSPDDFRSFTVNRAQLDAMLLILECRPDATGFRLTRGVGEYLVTGTDSTGDIKEPRFVTISTSSGPCPPWCDGE